jgi:hypothetical protein
MTRRPVVLAGVVAAVAGVCLLLPRPHPATPAPAVASPSATPAATSATAGRLARPPSPPAPASHPATAGSRPTTHAPATRQPAQSATQVAAAWTAAACAYTWQTPWQVHAGRQATLSTAALRVQLVSPRAAADWRAVVVADRVIAGCRITGALLMPEAPNTATVAYVRVAAEQTVTRRGVRTGPTVGYWPLRLVRAAAGWRVDSISGGG